MFSEHQKSAPFIVFQQAEVIGTPEHRYRLGRSFFFNDDDGGMFSIQKRVLSAKTADSGSTTAPPTRKGNCLAFHWGFFSLERGFFSP
jgi:hypothetical protein